MVESSLHISVTKIWFVTHFDNEVKSWREWSHAYRYGRTLIAKKASTLAVSHSTSSATSGGKFLFVHVRVGKSKFACVV